MKTLILISLNELNFDIVKKYLSNNKLKNLKKISENLIETQCEEDYKNLEPWIQWPTIYTGKNANEHNLFRLGDAGIDKKNTIFNDIENLGYRVGAISPMNVSNNLKNPAYFIPDPWTDTISDNSFWSKLTFKTLSYFIKTNAENNFDFKNYLKLLIIFIKFSKIKNYSTYLRLFFTSFKKKWRKALFLDLLLNDIHLDLLKSRKSDFSNLFLNGIAHIQHHYMLSSKISTKQVNPSWYISSSDDPVLEGLEIYEKILQDYTQLKNVKIVIYIL